MAPVYRMDLIDVRWFDDYVDSVLPSQMFLLPVIACAMCLGFAVKWERCVSNASKGPFGFGTVYIFKKGLEQKERGLLGI